MRNHEKTRTISLRVNAETYKEFKKICWTLSIDTSYVMQFFLKYIHNHNDYKIIKKSKSENSSEALYYTSTRAKTELCSGFKFSINLNESFNSYILEFMKNNKDKDFKQIVEMPKVKTVYIRE